MSESSERLEQLKSRLLRTEILAQLGGSLVSPEATEFVANLMREWFVIDNDGQFVQTDQTPLRTSDLRPMEVDQVGDYLKAKHPYLFKQSATPGVSNAQTVAAPLNKSEMSLAEKCQFIRANGEQAFLDLPASPTAAKPLSEKRRSEMSPAERARLIRELGSAAYMDLPA